MSSISLFAAIVAALILSMVAWYPGSPFSWYPPRLSPTSAEVSQSEAANAVNEQDPLYLRKKKIKARGRSQTILTSSKGVETDEGLTLGKKSLLGA